jgi:hypothetical protein
MQPTFAHSRPVSQPVSRLDSLQREFPLMGRLDGPAIVQTQLVRLCKTYRDAVRMCWGLKRRSRMTKAQLSSEAGLTAQHVSDYLALDDEPHRRSLPGAAIPAFEAVCGNTLVSQWIASQARLTVLEEMQARAAA